MPVYGYACAACGPFAAIRPMAAYREPAPCPACGAASERVLTVPASLGSAARRERRDGAAADGARASSGWGHPGGCGCCTR